MPGSVILTSCLRTLVVVLSFEVAVPCDDGAGYGASEPGVSV